jgi:hypothetical protein
MNNVFHLDVRHAADLDARPQEQPWLIDRLWLRSGVGLIGGAPKCCKTWLGLDMAVSIASHTHCLDTFPVLDPGPALVYLAEDSLATVRQRLDALCAHRRLVLRDVPLYAIDVPSLQLESNEHAQALQDAVERLRPKLLLLDPLVRLHQLDENSSHDMSALLNKLRCLQRRFDVAVVLVHHLSKKRRAQPGQALRGSSDLHAWSDSGLYLTQRGQRNEITVTIEHRAAATPAPLLLRLTGGGDGTQTHLEVLRRANDSSMIPSDSSPATRVLQVLGANDKPLTRAALRGFVRINNRRLGDVLVELERDGRVCHAPEGWCLRPPSAAHKPDHHPCPSDLTDQRDLFA